MLAFLKQMLESKRKSLQSEVKPPESVENMDISTEFMEIVRFSFKAKDLTENSELPAEQNKMMIKELHGRVEVLYHNIDINSSNVKFDDVVVLAIAYYNLGLIYARSKKDYDKHTAFTFFKVCLHLLQNKEFDRKAILTYIGALNEISILFKLEKDKVYATLKSAMNIYLTYTKEDNYLDPIYIPTIIGVEQNKLNPRIVLEDLHFKTLLTLATQYFVQPGNKHEFVTYMYELLKSQLSQIMSKETFREDCIDWVLTLFDLLRYFLINDRFVEAKNHLAIANYVIHRFYKDTLKIINPQTNEESKLRFIYLSDSYDYVRGISSRSWGAYGVLLLRFWLERYLQSKDKSCEVEFSNLEINSQRESNLLVFDIKEEAEPMFNQITNTRVLNLDDAKSVFKKILQHLDAAKTYFTPDTDIESYAKIILDISAAHKYLASFEQDRNKQLKLHKRRIDYLEDASMKFHTVIDMDAEFQIYKRVWYELVTSCSTVMDLIFEETYHDESKIMSKEVDRYAKLILGNIDLYLNV